MSKYDPVLRPFVAMMEKELHANSGKGDRPGWLAMSSDTCLLEIFYHLGKLQKAVKKSEGDAIGEYAADVANMCMMLADICGVINLVQHTEQPAPVDTSTPTDHAPIAWRVCGHYYDYESEANRNSTEHSPPHMDVEPVFLRRGCVILPDRCSNDEFGEQWDVGWNACLDEVTRLNPIKQ